jgi:hypothetical protein
MKEIVTYKRDSFKDFKGVEHKFTLCTISTRCDGDYTEYDKNGYEYYYNVKKCLSFGLSICNPNDEYNSIIGDNMAYSRATSGDFKVLVTRPGIINKNTVDALMNDFVEFIKRDPSTVIKGYNESAEKWKSEQEIIKEINNLTQEEKDEISLIASLSPEEISRAKEIAKLL